MIDIRFSELKDVRELSRTMRKKDQEEAIALGYQPHKALYYSYKHGLYRITALIDKQVAAMWGVSGAPMGLVGQPYLVTNNLIRQVSNIKIARIYKQEVKTMLELFPILENYVLADYCKAVRLLKIAGFTISKPIVFGPHKKLFRKFSISNV